MICEQCDNQIDTDFEEISEAGDICLQCEEDNIDVYQAESNDLEDKLLACMNGYESTQVLGVLIALSTTVLSQVISQQKIEKVPEFLDSIYSAIDSGVNESLVAIGHNEVKN